MFVGSQQSACPSSCPRQSSSYRRCDLLARAWPPGQPRAPPTSRSGWNGSPCRQSGSPASWLTALGSRPERIRADELELGVPFGRQTCRLGASPTDLPWVNRICITPADLPARCGTSEQERIGDPSWKPGCARTSSRWRFGYNGTAFLIDGSASGSPRAGLPTLGSRRSRTSLCSWPSTSAPSGLSSAHSRNGFRRSAALGTNVRGDARPYDRRLKAEWEAPVFVQMRRRMAAAPGWISR